VEQFIGCDAHKKFSVFVAVNEKGHAGDALRVTHDRELRFWSDVRIVAGWSAIRKFVWQILMGLPLPVWWAATPNSGRPLTDFRAEKNTAETTAIARKKEVRIMVTFRDPRIIWQYEIRRARSEEGFAGFSARELKVIQWRTNRTAKSSSNVG
jgi:hypothetical protein